MCDPIMGTILTQFHEDGLAPKGQFWYHTLIPIISQGPPQNKRIRILVIITDITIDSLELFRNILDNRNDTRGIFNCSVCLVTFSKCKNKGIISWKLCNSKAKQVLSCNMGMMI